MVFKCNRYDSRSHKSVLLTFNVEKFKGGKRLYPLLKASLTRVLEEMSISNLGLFLPVAMDDIITTTMPKITKIDLVVQKDHWYLVDH